MDYIRETVTSAPEADLSEEHVLRMHRLTTEDIDYPRNTPGAYRNVPVAAGDYQAPLPGEVGDLMDRFFEWFPETRDRDRWPECVRAIAAHFYLISIHPFGDGNGRTSRAAESFVLYRSGINSLGFYSLANFYYQHRPEYVEMLSRARFVHDDGRANFVDLTEFVRFALGGLRDELAGVHTETLGFVRQLAFVDYASQTLRADERARAAVTERRLRFVRALAGEPVDIAELRARTHPASALYRDATNRTLTRDINYLKDMGLIRVEDGYARAQLELMNQFSE